ncbi:hypothetical protein N8339_06005 [Gammaproteobacteria bacterium]|nr:hypothetical protein [Gammaproteobacteria bacterium]
MFGRNKVDDAKVQAKKDYESTVALDNIQDAPRALRARLAFRAKTNIEMTFIEGAKKMESFEKTKLAALLDGKGTADLEEPELTDPFKLIKSEKGTIVSYIPLEIAQQVFDIAGAFQKEAIQPEQAMNGGQAIMDRICNDLGIIEEIAVLEFLRPEPEEGEGEEPEED